MNDQNSTMPAPERRMATLDVPRAVNPSPVPAGAALDDPVLYFNKELSWIDFNWRVLALAMDERTPLLERVKFVAITASNLDEFVQKRIGGLQPAGGGRRAPALRRRAHASRSSCACCMPPSPRCTAA